MNRGLFFRVATVLKLLSLLSFVGWFSNMIWHVSTCFNLISTDLNRKTSCSFDPHGVESWRSWVYVADWDSIVEYSKLVTVGDWWRLHGQYWSVQEITVLVPLVLHAKKYVSTKQQQFAVVFELLNHRLIFVKYSVAVLVEKRGCKNVCETFFTAAQPWLNTSSVPKFFSRKMWTFLLVASVAAAPWTDFDGETNHYDFSPFLVLNWVSWWSEHVQMFGLLKWRALFKQ